MQKGGLIALILVLLGIGLLLSGVSNLITGKITYKPYSGKIELMQGKLATVLGHEVKVDSIAKSVSQGGVISRYEKSNVIVRICVDGKCDDIRVGSWKFVNGLWISPEAVSEYSSGRFKVKIDVRTRREERGPYSSGNFVDLTNYPGVFFVGGRPDGYIIYGKFASDDEKRMGGLIKESVAKLTPQHYGLPLVVESEGGLGGSSSDASPPHVLDNHNVILIGFPSTNTMMKAVLGGAERIEGAAGEGLIKIIPNGEYSMMIVTGVDMEGFIKAANVLINYRDYPYEFKGMKVRVTGDVNQPRALSVL